jgi:heterodisulfide reductase subunit A-like polyferredoxin
VRGLPAVKEVRESNQKVSIVMEDTLSGKELNLDLDLLVLAGGMMRRRLHRMSPSSSACPGTNTGFSCRICNATPMKASAPESISEAVPGSP